MQVLRGLEANSMSPRLLLVEPGGEFVLSHRFDVFPNSVISCNARTASRSCIGSGASSGVLAVREHAVFNGRITFQTFRVPKSEAATQVDADGPVRPRLSPQSLRVRCCRATPSRLISSRSNRSVVFSRLAPMRSPRSVTRSADALSCHSVSRVLSSAWNEPSAPTRYTPGSTDPWRRSLSGLRRARTDRELPACGRRPSRCSRATPTLTASTPRCAHFFRISGHRDRTQVLSFPESPGPDKPERHLPASASVSLELEKMCTSASWPDARSPPSRSAGAGIRKTIAQSENAQSLHLREAPVTAAGGVCCARAAAGTTTKRMRQRRRAPGFLRNPLRGLLSPHCLDRVHPHRAGAGNHWRTPHPGQESRPARNSTGLSACVVEERYRFRRQHRGRRRGEHQPNAGQHHARHTISFCTLLALAPSAIRTPISRVRCDTA